MAKFLFLLTEHGIYNELKYASCVAKKVAEQVKSLGHEVITIEKPSPKDANEAIRKYKPNVIWFAGHGNPTATTLENKELWIKAPDYNTDVLRGTVVCALSCYTGRHLGRYLTERKGCVAYLGYTERFWYPWCNDPRYYNCACSKRNPFGVRDELWKKIIECAHEANLYFIIGLARGMTAKKAAEYSINRFNYWIQYFESVKPANTAEFSIIRTVTWVLVHNRDATVLHGNTQYFTAVKSRMAISIPAVLIAVGLLLNCVKFGGGR